MAQEHDLVVIGAGPGGYVAAIRAAQLGLNVACVEQAPALGGTCLRIGCIPSKAMLESSELYWEAKQNFPAHGIIVPQVQLDLAVMLRRKEQIVTALTKGVEGLFKKNKVTRYFGQGRLDGPGRVVVQGETEKWELLAKNILLATGSKPTSLPGVEFDGQHIGTSTDALSYTQVPQHLVVIGAGYIGMELGSVWKRLGAKVTILEFLNRIFPGMDLEIARDAHRLFERQGLEIRLECKVKSARVQGSQVVVESEGMEPITCDKVLVATGRGANTEGLGLETIGLQANAKGQIPVDANFATSAQGIYAIGDVIGGLMLAHKAEEEGIACVEKLVKGYGHVNYDTIPGVVYTQPEIASVGKTEEQLQQENIPYRKGLFPFRANGRAQSLGQREGKVKMLAHAETDRILGVHILGPRAGDLIAEAVTAMTYEASSEDVARTVHAHPTLSETLKEAALAVDNRAIHM